MLRKKSTILQLGQYLALVASLLILGQIGYISLKGGSFCLNEGCKVVEQLTKVSPLIFNLTGLLFFQTIFWGIWAAGGERQRLPRWVPALLLTGLGVEAVLIPFQYLVARTFCAYCLGVLAFVVLLNLLFGLRHLLTGLVLSASVGFAFASLELNQVASDRQAFNAGVFASRPGQEQQTRHYLFFSSTCPHCEKVIASLKSNPRPTVLFNPIDRVQTLDLPGVRYTDRYLSPANRALLSSLGIKQIPVLISKGEGGMTILQGDTAIITHLEAAGRPAAAGPSDSSATPSSRSAIPGLDGQDSCQVSTDCTTGSSQQSPGH